MANFIIIPQNWENLTVSYPVSAVMCMPMHERTTSHSRTDDIRLSLHVKKAAIGIPQLATEQQGVRDRRCISGTEQCEQRNSCREWGIRIHTHQNPSCCHHPVHVQRKTKHVISAADQSSNHRAPPNAHTVDNIYTCNNTLHQPLCMEKVQILAPRVHTWTRSSNT